MNTATYRKPTIDLVAERLNVYPSQIYGVLTFYAQFHLKPRGRFIIRVCVGTACHVQGASRIVETFFDKLHIGHAETTPDLRYTFEKVACLGACGMAPLAMVNDATYGSMTVQKVERDRRRLQPEADEIACSSITFQQGTILS